MIIVGEKINGMFKAVGKAIDTRDKKVIQKLAIDQLNAGAHILDVNTGPGVENAPEVMKWLVHTIQEVTDAPLAIDTPNIETMIAGVKEVKGRVLINSCTAESEKMTKLFPLAKECNAEVICVTLNEKGIPSDPTGRCELAMQLITNAMELGISTEMLYLDPIILPIAAAQDQTENIFETLSLFKKLCEPAPKTIVGLSNVSSGTKERPLINRTYLIMLMAHGLDAAVLNPLDTELMNAVKTAEILLNKKLYCDDYLKA
jgi:5-methyltetrahydrofolate corrinoid/iron sulfur protein methyltransferase